MKEIQQFFKKHSDRKDVFQASDGTLFFLECDAQNYAVTLENKAVKKFSRAQKPSTDARDLEDEDVIADEALSAPVADEAADGETQSREEVPSSPKKKNPKKKNPKKKK